MEISTEHIISVDPADRKERLQNPVRLPKYPVETGAEARGLETSPRGGEYGKCFLCIYRSGDIMTQYVWLFNS